MAAFSFLRILVALVPLRFSGVAFCHDQNWNSVVLRGQFFDRPSSLILPLLSP